MAARRILLLEGSRLTAYGCRGGGVRVEGEFFPTTMGLEAFEVYLRKYASSRFYLLADVADEGFQHEDVPNVMGGDRVALIRRRLGQYFYGTSLAVAVSLGHAKTGRRDEKMLFAALTRPDAFTPWLEVLKRVETPFAGVYSVPLLLLENGARLIEDNGKLLLITLTRGGVRQSFFDRGKLLFSRLTPLAAHAEDEIGMACAGESGKMLQYLVGQRQVARGAPLRTVIAAHPDQTPALQRHCQGQRDLNFEFLDLPTIAQRVGLAVAPTDSYADIMFVHLLATRPPSRQFARSPERRFYRLWQIRQFLVNAAWAVLLACLLFAGKLGWQAQRVGQEIDAIKAQTLADATRYESILQGLPPIDLSSERLRALIVLSQALNATPQIALDRLDWKVIDAPEGAAKVGAGGTVAANKANPPSGPWVQLDVQAHLPLALAGDLRAQYKTIEDFAARLRSEQTQATVLTRPFDLESGKTLKNAEDADTASAATPVQPKFSLRIVQSR